MMIFLEDAKLCTFADVATGNLISWFGYRHSGEIAVVLPHPEGGRQLLRLDTMDRTTGVADTDTVLDFGKPRLAFDLDSALQSEEAAKPGTLLLLKTGPAVYWAHPTFSNLGVSFPIDGGEMVQGSRDYETPAFNRWEIGFDRDDAFVRLALIDV